MKIFWFTFTQLWNRTWLEIKKNCVIFEVSRTFRTVDLNANPVVYEVGIAITGAAFQIDNSKVYIPVVRLSINDKIKVLENIK